MIKGTISQWNDEKGFGFIEVPGQKTRVFFHVSSLKNRAYRPVVGEEVAFQATKDAQGRLKATTVTVLSAPAMQLVGKQANKAGHAPGRQPRSQRIHIDPPQKDGLDYLGILLLLGSCALAGYRFYAGQDPMTLWPFLIPLLGGFLLTQRSKTPKQSEFSCAKCHTVERFGNRTLAAWNRGMTRLFCQSCHSSWLREQPKNTAAGAGGKSGCLGALLMLLALPIMAGWALIQLFV